MFLILNEFYATSTGEQDTLFFHFEYDFKNKFIVNISFLFLQ